MWSIYDKQTGSCLHSGRNVETKERALEEAFEYWEGPQGEFTEEEIEELRNDKEEWLKNIGLVPIEHDEPIA